MRVFLSWSGERSKLIARALKTWLRDVIHDLDPWMSDHDIAAGERWGEKPVGRELQESRRWNFMLDNGEQLYQPWLLF